MTSHVDLPGPTVSNVVQIMGLSLQSSTYDPRLWQLVRSARVDGVRNSAPALRMIIPAAGHGSRLRSELPKPLVPVGGLPSLHRLVTLARCIGAEPIVVVRDEVRSSIRESLCTAGLEALLVDQESGPGMGFAVLDALAHTGDDDDILLVWGDMPAPRYSTAARTLLLHRTFRSQISATVPTVRRSEPYVALERDRLGAVYRVRQSRLGDSTPSIGESDCGMFVCRSGSLQRALHRLAKTWASSSEAPAELDFLPCLLEMQQELPVLCMRLGMPFESVSINTPSELEAVNTYYRRGTRCG